ncbi:hypothetical protein CUMW_243080 [Citrus unshiu]|uniref:SH3 domain-containing protein n=1 Tax=Citrus unshiu TaxID=55188 RepID=A0A2H5QM43_CITUN|nr:hypothetical protein CUMW_243080 [Citrus unshiu]
MIIVVTMNAAATVAAFVMLFLRLSSIYTIILQVIHPFDAQANGELSLSIDDYVVVRQVAPTGWSEGECKGQAGWFPSAYVERQEKAPASKISEANSSPEYDVTS